MATITSKGRNKWLVRVFLGRDEHGKQVFRNQTIIGTKKDADAYAYEQARSRRLMGTGAQLVSLTIGALLDDLVTDYRVNGKSLERCEMIVRVQLRPFFGQMAAEKVTTNTVRAYMEKRQSDGVANGTINRELALLRRALNLGYRCTPPKVQRVTYIPRLQENNVRTGFFEDGEYRALLTALPERLKPVLAFAYYTGCRRGEILSLQWPQVDLAEGVVRLEPGTTKNKHGRGIPLNQELLEMLKMQKDIRDQEYPACPWVFTYHGEPIKSIKTAWAHACRRAGLVDANGKPARLFHDLRRTGIRNNVRSGVSEKIAMQISGHRSRSVFDRYDITNEQDLKQAARKQFEYLERMRTDEKTEAEKQVAAKSCTIVALTPSKSVQ